MAKINRHFTLAGCFDAGHVPQSTAQRRTCAGIIALLINVNKMDVWADMCGQRALLQLSTPSGKPDPTTGESIGAFVVLKRAYPTDNEARQIAKNRELPHFANGR